MARFIIALLLLSVISAQGAEVTLAWDKNTEPEVNMYRLYWGPDSGNYTKHLDTDNTTITISGFKEGVKYYFAVMALVVVKSDFSEEISYKVPNPSCNVSLCHIPL